MEQNKFLEKLNELTVLGKKNKNILEYQAIKKSFQNTEISDEQVDELIEYLEEQGIDVILIFDNENCIEELLSVNDAEKVDIENIDFSFLESIPTKNPYRMYLEEIDKAPVLSDVAQTALARRIEEGDQEAKKLLIDATMRLVVSIAERYKGAGNAASGYYPGRKPGFA